MLGSVTKIRRKWFVLVKKNRYLHPDDGGGKLL
jgi:hypothetical protein